MNLESETQAALIIARGLHFGATAVLWGGGGLLCLLPREGESPSILRLAAWLAGLSGAAWLGATLVLMTDDPASLIDPGAWMAFAVSSFGPPWAIRLALLCGCAIVACFEGRRAATVPLTILGGALAIDQAWLGHAATGTGLSGALMLVTQVMHILAVYAWTGSLAILGLMMGRGDERIARALALFSGIGLLVVATIVATGLLNASCRLENPAQLLTTPYGRLVSLKAGLVVAMVVLAWINRTFATSSRRVLAETLLGAVVLGVAAILGVSAPPG